MKINNEHKYSVFMPIYYKDNPDWLIIAINSMLNQTVFPDEFVIVKDGEVTVELNSILNDYKRKYPKLFKILSIKTNIGVGLASKYAIENCNNNFIARMDSDDYALPNRIEEQLKALYIYPQAGVIGCWVEEFTNSIDNIVSHVVLPEKHDDILKFARKRCPIRHSALLFKKEALLRAGNYNDIRIGEDYDITVRIMMCGYEIYNLPYPYVYMRVNSDFYKRRGGIKFFKAIYKLKKHFKDIGFYSTMDFLYSFVFHAIVCLVPNFVRRIIYMKLLRKE